eukprot:146786-Pelagomonas_calceolata.AAC.1
MLRKRVACSPQEQELKNVTIHANIWQSSQFFKSSCLQEEKDALKICVKLFKVLKKVSLQAALLLLTGGKEEVYSFFSKIFDLAKEK